MKPIQLKHEVFGDDGALQFSETTRRGCSASTGCVYGRAMLGLFLLQITRESGTDSQTGPPVPEHGHAVAHAVATPYLV